MSRRRSNAVESYIDENVIPIRRGRKTRASKSVNEKVIKDKFLEDREVQIKPIHAKTENQKLYLESLQSNMLTVGKGSAGVGKTFVAASVAANKYLKGEVHTIIVMRSAARLGTNTGFYPGTVEDKLAPFLAPILNVIKDRIGAKRYEAEYGKSILIQPMEAIRGMSFKAGTFVIIDEAQNTTPEEIRSLVTRMEEKTFTCLCGDDKQHDMSGTSGIVYLSNLIRNNNLPGCEVVEFTPADIVRSGLVRKFVELFEAEGPPPR